MADLVENIGSKSSGSDGTSSDFVERRDYIRVRDAVGLVVRPLKSLPAAGDTDYSASGRPRGNASTDRTKVRKNNKYDIPGYAAVKSDYPAVADYISSLEERIRTLLVSSDSPSEAPSHIVSLSAGGVAFAEDQHLEVDEPVTLEITLFPGLERISCDARIVTVGDAQEVGVGEKHTYRAVYTRISDDDQATLDAHVEKLLGGIQKHGHLD